MAWKGMALALSAITALGGVSCGGNAGAAGVSPPTPTSGTPDIVLTGTLTPGGATTHAFDVDEPGQVDLTLTSLDPEAASVGLLVGVAGLASCSELTSTTEARPGLTLSGWVVDATYCVTVFDVGDLAGRTAYRLTIKRP